MKFGPVPIDQCLGGILAHSVFLPPDAPSTTHKKTGRKIAKGSVITAELQKIIADNGITSLTIARLDANELDEDMAATRLIAGLLPEIASRALPRKMTERRMSETSIAGSNIAGVLLAAGQSRRMGNVNKLLGDSDGQPLVRRCARAMLDGGIEELIVVTGHQAEQIEVALAGLPLRFVHNPDFATGQARSVATGIAALSDIHNGSNNNIGPDSYSGALIGLGDMPYIGADLIRALIADHLALPNSHSRISFPEHDGRRGNPVIWGQAFFDDLKILSGDSGGRQILGDNVAAVNSFGWHDSNIHFDIDTPQDALDASGNSGE